MCTIVILDSRDQEYIASIRHTSRKARNMKAWDTRRRDEQRYIGEETSQPMD